jgi:hypothetical protein
MKNSSRGLDTKATVVSHDVQSHESKSKAGVGGLLSLTHSVAGSGLENQTILVGVGDVPDVDVADIEVFRSRNLQVSRKSGSHF